MLLFPFTAMTGSSREIKAKERADGS